MRLKCLTTINCELNGKSMISNSTFKAIEFFSIIETLCNEAVDRKAKIFSGTIGKLVKIFYSIICILNQNTFSKTVPVLNVIEYLKAER